MFSSLALCCPTLDNPLCFFCHGYTGSRLPLAQTLATPFSMAHGFGRIEASSRPSTPTRVLGLPFPLVSYCEVDFRPLALVVLCRVLVLCLSCFSRTPFPLSSPLIIPPLPSSPTWLLRGWPPNMIQTDALVLPNSFSYCPSFFPAASIRRNTWPPLFPFFVALDCLALTSIDSATLNCIRRFDSLLTAPLDLLFSPNPALCTTSPSSITILSPNHDYLCT
ncbi:MAG: hypothetical protein J3Q66DRAFT_324775 [Benniella sp.]|nr:MAG: hypothetical protein J3Q66DRAFT_324775 [Benniella sp.]